MEKPSDEIKKARFEWKMMIARCEDKDRWDYSYYGARGIDVCGEWHGEDGFKRFYNYVKHLKHYGEKGYTLDRIDNDGDYKPGNVRWATRKQQNKNRRGGEGFGGMEREKSN